jgi:hypothetical protein
MFIFSDYQSISWSRDSSVGIATRYGLKGPGIESGWGEIFRTYPDRLLSPSSLLYNGYRFFPGGKGGRGVMLTTHPILVPRLRKSLAIPPLTLWVLLGLLRDPPPHQSISCIGLQIIFIVCLSFLFYDSSHEFKTSKLSPATCSHKQLFLLLLPYVIINTFIKYFNCR